MQCCLGIYSTFVLVLFTFTFTKYWSGTCIVYIPLNWPMHQRLLVVLKYSTYESCLTLSNLPYLANCAWLTLISWMEANHPCVSALKSLAFHVTPTISATSITFFLSAFICFVSYVGNVFTLVCLGSNTFLEQISRSGVLTQLRLVSSKLKSLNISTAFRQSFICFNSSWSPHHNWNFWHNLCRALKTWLASFRSSALSESSKYPWHCNHVCIKLSSCFFLISWITRSKS